MKKFAFILSLLCFAVCSCGNDDDSILNEGDELTEEEVNGAPNHDYIEYEYIYKLSGDYSEYVPIYYDWGSKTILGYPGVNNINLEMKPVKLDEGFYCGGWLAGAERAFLNCTYEEYMNLPTEPDERTMQSMIIKEARVTELYGCPRDGWKSKDEKVEWFNSLIANGLKGCKLIYKAE